MIATTRAIGGVLTVVGIASYVTTGGASVTALLPTFLGLPLLALGLLAGDPDRARWAVPGAAAVAALGLVATLGNLVELPALLTGGEVARPTAVITSAITALLCLPVLIAWRRAPRPQRPAIGDDTFDDVGRDDLAG